jgi:hypothetical protein
VRRALTVLLLLAPLAAAHSVPDDVRTRAFLKPSGDHMTILVRMPANALIDILFPVVPGTGGLDLRQTDGYAAAGAQVWIADLITLYENGRELPAPRVVETRVSALGDLSFSRYDDALRHLQGERLPPDTFISQDDAAIDTLLEVPIRSADSGFSFEPRFARLGVRVTTTLRFLPSTGGIRQYVYEGDPGTIVLNPPPTEAVALFMRKGGARVADSVDSLLFLLSAALIFRCGRAAPITFLALFAAAQAGVLIGSAEGWVSAPLPAPVCDTIVSATIVLLAIEVILTSGESDLTPLAIVGGLAFGFTSWLPLQPEIQFGGSHRALSAVGFTLGLALAQFALVAVVGAALQFAVRLTKSPRTAVAIAAAMIIRVSWRRMIDGAHALGSAGAPAPAVEAAIVLFALFLVAAEVWRRRFAARLNYRLSE